MTDTIAEIAVALLAAGGLLLGCWLMFGRMLLPVGSNNMPIYAVLPASGSGQGLEQAVEGLLWLRSGNLVRFTIVVADDGLDETGCALAAAIRRRESDLVVCPMAELEQYIKDATQDGYF